MKSTDKKIKFVELRAAGNSYSKIAEELGISKATCSHWGNDLKERVEALKRERMEELYTLYGMTRERRIKALGDVLERIDKAISGKDFTELSLDKLIDYRLKYADALKGEYIELPVTAAAGSIAEIAQRIDELLAAIQTGADTSRVKTQLSILCTKAQTIRELENDKLYEVMR